MDPPPQWGPSPRPGRTRTQGADSRNDDNPQLASRFRPAPVRASSSCLIVDPVEQDGVVDEIIVHGPPVAEELAVVIDDQDASRLEARVQVLEFVPGRVVPVGIEPQQRDSVGRLGGDGLLDQSLDKRQQRGVLAGGEQGRARLVHALDLDLLSGRRKSRPLCLHRATSNIEVSGSRVRHRGEGVVEPKPSIRGAQTLKCERDGVPVRRPDGTDLVAEPLEPAPGAVLGATNPVQALPCHDERIMAIRAGRQTGARARALGQYAAIRAAP